MSTSTESFSSQRVNSSLLPSYTGKAVRLTCRPLRTSAAGWTVQAPDGGEVTVTLLSDQLSSDSFYEVKGQVVNGTTVKALQVMKLEDTLDMALVNDTINMMHDPRFFNKIFVEE
ncbi:hypothetical protein MSAN_00999400 [Mycena sanguinolenta]|uniref:Replication factor A protein 3 n=1 Tax=Mycena sanguinolenta TaxID=230812 RepID=A0A8H6YRF1_9AGAR|nr:hypothetical protein MSAN_00999400 [Mycena sanguinolenta]